MNVQKFNELIKRISIDENAYIIIYSFYFPKLIFYYARKYGKAFAEDIAQEFFFKRLKTIKIIHDIESPMKWMLKCSSYVMLDLLRKETNTLELREEVLSASMKDESDEIILATHDLLDDDKYFDSLVDAGLSKKIVSAFQKLGKETTEILIMYYIEGYSQKEIAEILNMNYNTLRSKLTRGVTLFRRIFPLCNIRF